MSHDVTVRYFAAAAEAAGTEEEQLTLSVNPTLSALRATLIERHGAAMSKVLRGGSFLVDGKVRRDDGMIASQFGGESASFRVDVLPPFAGG